MRPSDISRHKLSFALSLGLLMKTGDSTSLGFSFGPEQDSLTAIGILQQPSFETPPTLWPSLTCLLFGTFCTTEVFSDLSAYNPGV